MVSSRERFRALEMLLVPRQIPRQGERFEILFDGNVAGPLTSRFRDIPESAENLPKSEKMGFRQGGGGRHNKSLPK